MALVLHVERTEGAGVAVSALLLAHAIPSLLGPLAGALADRVDHRKLMILCDLGQVCLFLLIATTLPSLPILILMVAGVAVLETIFRPAGRSAVPAFVASSDLMTANAWLGTALNMGAAVGPLAGGVLVALLGVSGAIVANAFTFLLSAAILMGLPPLPPEGEEEHPGFLTTVREGLSFARTDPITRAVGLGLFLGVAAGALDNVALVFIATRELDAGATGYGLLSSAFGIGMIGASMFLIRRGGRLKSASGLFVLGWFGTAIGNLGVGLAPVLAVAALAQLSGGAGNGVSNVAGDTLLQQRVPKRMLGRAVGITGSAPFLGMLIAYGVGGVLVDLTSARAAFIVSGIATGVVTLLIWAMLARAEKRA